MNQQIHHNYQESSCLIFGAGMSPILKLNKTALERPADSQLIINTKVNATSDPLAKVKWGDLYYNEVGLG